MLIAKSSLFSRDDTKQRLRSNTFKPILPEDDVPTGWAGILQILYNTLLIPVHFGEWGIVVLLLSLRRSSILSSWHELVAVANCDKQPQAGVAADCRSEMGWLLRSVFLSILSTSNRSFFHRKSFLSVVLVALALSLSQLLNSYIVKRENHEAAFMD